MDMIQSFRGEYAFLSNFYECYIHYNGMSFRNAEAAFQAQKTLSQDIRLRFQKMDARTAKKEGRQVPLRTDWIHVKVYIMYGIVKAKFMQNPVLADLLMLTSDKYIEEGNNWGDTFWGVVNGEGKNVLGRILMMVREELIAENDRKYLPYCIIEKKDALKYLTKEQYIVFEEIQQQILQGRLKNGEETNAYYVCNANEPYADIVHDIMILGEQAKNR